MALTFEIVYHEKVTAEDIPRLSSAWKTKIRTAIADKLAAYPDLYGKPLRRSLKGYRKLRVGDYRVVFRIAEPRILILAILHRSVVYQIMEKRV
jgi:mRNA interferase RelE/StbE